MLFCPDGELRFNVCCLTLVGWCLIVSLFSRIVITSSFLFSSCFKYVNTSTETHVWGNNDRPPCWQSKGRQVSHQRWISRNVHHTCLHQVQIRLWTLTLKVTRSPKQGYQWPIKKDMCPPEVCKTRYSVEFIQIWSCLNLLSFLMFGPYNHVQ